VADWEERAARAAERHDDGARRLPEGPDERQRQLTRMGNAAWAVGLSLLMLGRREEAAAWLIRAAERYRESWPDAPPGSWGRPIGAMKARLVAGDLAGAVEDARWTLDAGAPVSESPIGRYAAALAHLVLWEDKEAGVLAATLQGRDDFPPEVADALVAVSAHDVGEYGTAIRALLVDFESRDEFLEDIPVADTVAALQVLAQARGSLILLESPLLPTLAEGFIGYEAVVESLREFIGRRVEVTVTSSDPDVSLASIVGRLESESPRASIYSGGKEEGVIFVLKTSDLVPDSTFGIWRDPTGIGNRTDARVAWRVGSVAIIVDLLPVAYGYPSD